MKTTSNIAWLSLIVFVLSVGVALADLGPPRKRPPRIEKDSSSVPFSVVTDRRAKTVRLVIPKKFVAAAMRDNKVGAAAPRSRSVMAGIALSMAIASLFLLGQPKRSVAIAGVVVLIVAGSFGAYQIANADVPPIEPNPQKVLSKNRVVLEIVEEGDSIELIRPVASGRPSGRTRSEPPSDGAAPPR